MGTHFKMIQCLVKYEKRAQSVHCSHSMTEPYTRASPLTITLHLKIPSLTFEEERTHNFTQIRSNDNRVAVITLALRTKGANIKIMCRLLEAFFFCCQFKHIFKHIDSLHDKQAAKGAKRSIKSCIE